jgi:hypothetical protein
LSFVLSRVTAAEAENVGADRYYRTCDRSTYRSGSGGRLAMTDPGWDIPGIARGEPPAASAAAGSGPVSGPGLAAEGESRPGRKRGGKRRATVSVSALDGSSAGAFARPGGSTGLSEDGSAAPVTPSSSPPVTVRVPASSSPGGAPPPTDSSPQAGSSPDGSADAAGVRPGSAARALAYLSGALEFLVSAYEVVCGEAYGLTCWAGSG